MYLGLSILELSKILMYDEFWYDIYIDIAEDAETRVFTSNYELECIFIEKPLPKGRDKKVIGLMKDEVSGKIMTKCFRLKAKTYLISYLIDYGSEDKKATGT